MESRRTRRRRRLHLVTPHPHATMTSSLRQWNTRQLCVLQRFGRIHHVALTPDLVSGLASRYAAKHADERPPAGTSRLGRSRAGELAAAPR